MESYIKTYFEEGAYKMIAMMKEAGLSEVPILPILSDRKSPEFIEVMDTIGNFFNKNKNVKNYFFNFLDIEVLHVREKGIRSGFQGLPKAPYGLGVINIHS